MKLNHGLHLAYCTNIHRGETWAETFDSLKTHTLAVRERVCPHEPFAIGLRLSASRRRGIERPAKRFWNSSAGSKKTPATFSRSTDFPTASFTARA